MKSSARSKSGLFGRLSLHIVVALVAVLQSCSVNPATGRTSLTGLMSTSEEVRVGREQNPQVLQAFGGKYDDPALAAYVDRIGQSLARNAERPDLTFTFTILDTPIVNAIALPGGYIYLTRGLLALASSECELAGVLGHEIGHIAARHHAQTQTREILTGLGVTILGAVAGAPIAHGTQLIAGLFLRAYSRDEEYEADVLGIRYMVRAGYDPSGMASFLHKLNQWTQLQARILGQPSSDLMDYLSTHPNTLERVREATAAAQIKPAPNAIVGEDIYLKRIDGILFGEAPSQGVIRGRQYIHPIMRIRFEAPKGHQLFDTPKAVYALGADNARIVFDAVSVPTQTSAAAYVEQGARQSNLSDVRRLEINGLEAATGWGRVRTNRGIMDFRIVGIRGSGTALYRFRFLLPTGTMSSQLSPVERETLQSFRRITRLEASALKPLRIHIITVRSGQTQGELAGQMAFEKYKQERFQVLNGLGPGVELSPGMLVKIISK